MGGANDTLDRDERYIGWETGGGGRARTVGSWLVEVEWLEHKNKDDMLNIIINYLNIYNIQKSNLTL